MTINKTIPFSFGILFSAMSVAADNAAPVIIDASPCLEIVSPIERLACFEAQANAVQGRGTAIPQQNQPVVSGPRDSGQQPSQPAPQTQPRPASETPQVVAQEPETARIPPADSVENNFGLPEEKFSDEKAKADELSARVATLKELAPNRFLITLQNGQVWEQMQSKRFALEEGDEVRIYSTRWGSSYRLASLSHKGFIQVQRLR
jgi:hypothetical protein